MRDLLIPGEMPNLVYTLYQEDPKSEKKWFRAPNGQILIIRPSKFSTVTNHQPKYILKNNFKKVGSAYLSQTLGSKVGYGKVGKSDLVILQFEESQLTEIIKVKNGWPFFDTILFQFLYNKWN